MLLVYGLAFMVILPVVVVSVYKTLRIVPVLFSCVLVSGEVLRVSDSPSSLSLSLSLQGTWWYRSIRYSGDHELNALLVFIKVLSPFKIGVGTVNRST